MSSFSTFFGSVIGRNKEKPTSTNSTAPEDRRDGFKEEIDQQAQDLLSSLKEAFAMKDKDHKDLQAKYDSTVTELEVSRSDLAKIINKVKTQDAVAEKQEELIKALEGQEKIAGELTEKLEYLTKVLEASNRDNKLKLQGLELRKMAEKIGGEKEVIYKKIIEKKDATIADLEKKLACYRASDAFQRIPASPAAYGVTGSMRDNGEFVVKRTFDDFGDNAGCFDAKRQRKE